MNDREFEVVARNAILLLYVLVTFGNRTIDDEATIPQLANSMIHIWYSAFIPPDLLLELKASLQVLVADVCGKIKDKKPETVLGKTWSFRMGQSFRLILTKTQWLRFNEYWKIPDQLSRQQAAAVRATVVLAPERKDCRDRWHFKEHSPFTRVANEHFRQHGVLLPDGHAKTSFSAPNPQVAIRLNPKAILS